MGYLAKMHPVANWLRLPAHETRRALDKVLDFRDKASDPNASGMPPAAVEWFYGEELPRLCMRPDVRLQVEQQIQELLQQIQELLQQAATVEAEISPQAAALQQRLDDLAAQVDILEAAIGHD